MLMKVKELPIGELIKCHLENRKIRQEVNAAYKRRAATLEAQKTKIDGLIIEYLNQTGAKSIRTDEGTASTKLLPKATVGDAEVLMNFVIDQKQFQLLKRAVNTYAVQDYLEKHNKVPPGVNFSRYQTVNVLSPQEPALKEPQDE